MTRASKPEKSRDESLPRSDNSELNELVWQKWITKNKERDAAHQKKLIRILWLASVLLAVSAVVWLLTMSK